MAILESVHDFVKYLDVLASPYYLWLYLLLLTLVRNRRALAEYLYFDTIWMGA